MKVKTSFASSIHFSILHTALVFMALQILVSNILARSLNIPFPLIFFCTSSILQSNTNRVSLGSTADFPTKATLDRGTDKSGSSKRLHSPTFLNGTCLITLHHLLKLRLTDFWILSFETHLVVLKSTPLGCAPLKKARFVFYIGRCSLL